MRLAAALIVGLGLLVLATPAAAIECRAPPGTAAVDQYCETIPTATGDKGAGTGATRARQPVPPQTVAALAESATGRQLNAMLEAKPSGSKKRAEAADPERPSVQVEVPSPNPLLAVTSALEAGATISSGFPLLLLVSAILLAAAAWIAYRRRT